MYEQRLYEVWVLSMKHLTIILAFLMTIGTQASANKTCYNMGDDFQIIENQEGAKDWLLENPDAEVSFKQKYGYGSIKALEDGTYDEFIKESNCGQYKTGVKLRPEDMWEPTPELRELCWRNLPVNKDLSGVVMVKILRDGEEFVLRYKGDSCKFLRYR